MGVGGGGAITLAGVVFLLTLVLTGWSGLLVLLTPSFLLLLVPVPEPTKQHVKVFYRFVTRFVYVGLG